MVSELDSAAAIIENVWVWFQIRLVIRLLICDRICFDCSKFLLFSVMFINQSQFWYWFQLQSKTPFWSAFKQY